MEHGWRDKSYWLVGKKVLGNSSKKKVDVWFPIITLHSSTNPSNKIPRKNEFFRARMKKGCPWKNVWHFGGTFATFILAPSDLASCPSCCTTSEGGPHHPSTHPSTVTPGRIGRFHNFIPGTNAEHEKKNLWLLGPVHIIFRHWRVKKIIQVNYQLRINILASHKPWFRV